MAGKRGKKRQRQADVQPSLNLENEAGGGLDSIDSCLADLERATNPLYSSAKKEEETTAEKQEDDNPSVTPAGYSRRERVQGWDSAWAAWIGGGTYNAGLLPCFETELARHFQMKKLSSYLLESCRSLKMPVFERWLLDSKLEEKHLAASVVGRKRPGGKTSSNKNRHDDPVLPSNPSVNSQASQRLLEEICETGVVEQEAAGKIVKELIQRTKSALVEIQSQHLRCVSQTPSKSDRIEAEHGSYLVSMLYSRKKWKSPFIVKITSAHYEKLKQRFLETHQKTITATDFDSTNKKKKARIQHTLHLLLMVITLRYSSFSGGQLLDDFRGGGMQGAINEQGFEVLKEFFPPDRLFECFASPLNVTLPFFASAFEELDWHFGSVGDLARCDNFQEGCCGEANPPFTPGYMEFLSLFISHQLAQADVDERALSFVVIIPSVHDKDLKADAGKVVSAVKRFAARAHRQMVRSSTCTKHIVLPAKEHGYVEGAQHLRPTRYKRSLYDTSVILLQSKAAQAAQLDKEKFESRIREAFAERHSDEHKKRKKE